MLRDCPLPVPAKIDKNQIINGLSFYFLTKAFRHTQSALINIQTGYPDEAGILARTIFNLAVDYLYIAEDPLLRGERFSYHHHASIWQYINVLKENNPKLYRKYTKEQLKKLSGKAEKFYLAYDPEKKATSRCGWAGLPISERAKRVGLGKQYATVYKTLSNEEHPSAVTANNYIKITKEGLKLELEPKEDVFKELVLVFDMLSIVTEKFCHINSLPTDTLIKIVNDFKTKEVNFN